MFTSQKCQPGIWYTNWWPWGFTVSNSVFTCSLLFFPPFFMTFQWDNFSKILFISKRMSAGSREMPRACSQETLIFQFEPSEWPKPVEETALERVALSCNPNYSMSSSSGQCTNVWDGQWQLQLPLAMVMPLSKVSKYGCFTKIASHDPLPFFSQFHFYILLNTERWSVQNACLA